MIRFAILYFVLLVVFIAMVAGPLVAGKYLKFDPLSSAHLMQPVGLNNNDTKSYETGGTAGGTDAAAPTATGAASSPTDGAGSKFKYFI